MAQARDILDRVGHYEIVAPIATGGMAEVYEVRDLISLEHQALKLLVNPLGRELFDLEYEIMNRLNHPSIVRTHQYGMHEGLPWFSMELLTAQSAGKHCRMVGKPGTAARLEEVQRIGALLARALHHVHLRGIVHRDVKSSNVMVLPDNRVKLVDFGVAWLKSGGEPDREDKTFIGTVGYAPPEQLRNEPIDQRSDLYALGVLLYRMSTGKMPFKSRNPGEIVQMQFESDGPNPHDVVSNLPKRMAETIQSMMARDPDERPKTASEVADMFDSLAGMTILPGSKLAIHRPRASYRHSERHALGHSDAPLTLLVSDDVAERGQVLRDLEHDLTKAKWATSVGLVEDSSDRAPLQAALNLSRDLGTGERMFAGFQVKSPIAPMTIKLLGGVVSALGRIDNIARVVIAVDPADADGPLGAQFPDAHVVGLEPLGPTETALAVGGMLGRRPPSGALASRIHKVTSGWPTAIVELVSDLVDQGAVEADGNQILWSRYTVTVQVPPSLQQSIEARAEGLNAQQKLILNALALMGDTSMEALKANIPHSGGALENVVVALQDRGIVDYDPTCGDVSFRTDVMASALRDRLGTSTRVGLERMFVRSPEMLPLSPFRIRTLIRTGSHEQAVRDAIELAGTWVQEGRWSRAAELLSEVYDGVHGLEMSDELAEMILLYAECGAVTRAHTTQGAVHALTVVQRAELNAPLKVRSALAAARLQLSIGHYGNYQKKIGAALALARELDAPGIDSELQYERGRSELWAGNVTAAQRAFGRALEADTENRYTARILAGQARCLYERGQLGEAETLADQAIEKAEGDRGALGDGLRVWADSLRRQGRFSEAFKRLRQACIDLRTHPDQRPFLQVQLALGWCEAELNRLGEAQECVDELAAALRKGERMHFRLERDLLDAKISVLSGRPRLADYALQSVVRKAKTAGLRMLADQATVAMIEAQYEGRVPHTDLAEWFTSRKLQFLADKLIWVWADTCLLYAKYHDSKPDPADLMEPVLKKLEGENVFGVRIEAMVAQTAFELGRDSPQAALASSRDAAGAVRMLMHNLDDSERGAFRVHRWNTLIGTALDEAMRRSGAPVSRR